MVDLAREERVKRYEKLLVEFQAIKALKRMEKLSKLPDDVSKWKQVCLIC
jgi:hypothetical protein